MSNTNTPTKTRKANGSIAFPENFTQIKRNVQSTLNPELESCLFTFRGKEYISEFSGIVLREMGWKDFDNQDKERISLYWVDQVIHGVNGVLWSPSGYEDNKSSFFGGSLNILKPTFSSPTSHVLSNGDVKVTYWFSDLKNKNVKQLQVIFDTNGDIKSRNILTTNTSQFYTGLTSIIGGTALVVGCYLLRSKILKIRFN